MTYLDDIISRTRTDLEERKKAIPRAELLRVLSFHPPPLSLRAALSGEGMHFICEIKKASPSQGVIRQDFNPAALARAYAESGAAAISVLTEERFFQGRLEYLATAGEATQHKLPLLRKDFIIDPYQVYEARARGADAILLIAAILAPPQLRSLLELARSLGMDAVVEAHSGSDVKSAVDSGADVIGLNNRDLDTFKVDLTVTERLRPLVPPGKIVVAESGIHARAGVLRMQAAGVNAVLVGEALMRAPDPAAKLKELRG